MSASHRPLNPPAVLAIILASYLMIVLDISIVITALPQLQRDLGFSATGLSWVQNAYLLAFGGLLLLGARAGDIFGRRRVFVVGLALFAVASVAVGLAQSAAWLIAARGLQGVGAAILAPSTLALLSASFAEGPARTRAVSSYAAVAGVGATVGLVAGGLFAGLISWRVGFFINAPLGLAMALAAPRYLPETARRPGRLDVAGIIGSTLGMGALVFGIVRAADAGWADATALATLAAGVALLALFVLNERRAAQPIMPLRLFARRERAGAYAARLLFLGAMAPFWFLTTQFLQDVVGYDPVWAGLAFLPTTLANFLAALAVPRLTGRFGNARVLVGALITGALGLAWLGRLTADTGYPIGVALPMILIGIGQGDALGPLTAAGLADVAPEDVGAASEVTNVAHQLGGSLGLGLLVAVFAVANDPSLTGGDLLAHRIAAALTAGAALLTVALVVAVATIARPREGTAAGSAARPVARI